MATKMEVAGQEGDFSQPLLNATIANRPSFAHVTVTLNDQKVLADAGSMMWMDSELDMNTWCHGDCCDCCCRPCAGQYQCQNLFGGTGDISFGFDLPGDILPFAVTPEQGWIVSSGGFICGTPNLEIGCRFAGCAACCCSGEGAYFAKINSREGNGMFYAGSYGALQRHDVPAGQTFFIDTGLFFAANEFTKVDIGLPGECATFCCGGEGFVMKFVGPAVLYTQNRDPVVMAALLNPYRHQQMDQSGGSGGDAASGAASAIGSMF
jgi:uncharacterized protein (AIM24 family)